MSEKENPIHEKQNLKPMKSSIAIKVAYGFAAVLIVGSLCFMAYILGQRSVQQKINSEEEKVVHKEEKPEVKENTQEKDTIDYKEMIVQFKKNPTLGKAQFLSRELNEDSDNNTEFINECAGIVKNLIINSSNLSLRDRIQYIEAFPQQTEEYLNLYQTVYNIFEDKKIKVYEYKEEKGKPDSFIETKYTVGSQGWINISLQQQNLNEKEKENSAFTLKSQSIKPNVIVDKLKLEIITQTHPVTIELSKEDLVIKEKDIEYDYLFIKEANTLERYKAKYDMNIRMSPSKDSDISKEGIKANEDILIIYKEEKDGFTWGWLANKKGWVCIKEGNREYLSPVKNNESVNV